MNRLAVLALAIVVSCGGASAQSSDKKYGPGVTDHEIKLGQTVPYSGPVSPAAALARGAPGSTRCDNVLLIARDRQSSALS